MSPYKLRPQPGGTIDPKDAVGRSAVVDRAFASLRAGNNLVIADPRRMGKTVLLSLLAHRAPDDVVVVSIDYEGVSSTEEFLLRTAEAIRAHAAFSARAFEGIRVFFEGWEAAVAAGPLTVNRALGERSAPQILREMVERVDKHLGQETTLVVLMDEVPIAIKDIAENEGSDDAGLVLQALRHLRLRPGSRIRWILCGSVGFHHVLHRAGETEGVINDLVNLPLGPLAADEAHELADRLLAGIGRDGHPDGASALAQACDGIAFLVHALAHLLADGAGPVGPAEVEHAFADFLDDRDGSRAVTHLVTRLGPYYGENAKAAEALLDDLAVRGPQARAGLQTPPAVTDQLIDDHYLVLRRGQVDWRYPALRRVWAHRRGLAT